jgi:transposase
MKLILFFRRMGCAKKRIEPKILNHVNRNFNELYTKQVIKAVIQLPPPWKSNKKGRKGHDPKEVATGCILKVGFNQTYDGIEAYLNESETFKNAFDDLPGHSVIHRGMTKLSITYIRKVMNRVTRFLRRKGMNIAVDSTGFRTGNSSVWYDIRIHRNNTKHDCMKLHISMDVDTGIIHWFIITPSKRHDSPEFKNLLKHLPTLGAVFGDKGYSSRNNCQRVADKHGVPYLHFKDNATNKAKGKPAWIISIRAYKNNTEQWLSVYHFRSIVESVFSSIKRRWGSFLRSRRKWMQKKELSLKVLSYNIKQVLLVAYAKESKIPLWKSCK